MTIAIEALGRSREALAGYVLDRQLAEGGWGSDLDSAFGLIVLLNSGCRGDALQRAADWLLARQQDDGGWGSGAFFRDFERRYYGGRALTTALCVESLARLASYELE